MQLIIDLYLFWTLLTWTMIGLAVASSIENSLFKKIVAFFIWPLLLMIAAGK